MKRQNFILDSKKHDLTLGHFLWSGQRKLLIGLGWVLGAALLLVACAKPSLPSYSAETSPERLLAGYNAQRWYFADVPLDLPLKILKKKKIGVLADPFLLPINDRLIVTSYNGYLVSLERFKMSDVARSRLARGISTSPTFFRPLVFIAAEKGKFGLQAYDLLQRKTIWRKKGWFSRSSPLAKERMVIHAALNGTVAAFNMVTGERIWQYQSPQPITTNMAMRADTLVFCSPNGLLTALHALDGKPLWKMELAHHVYAAPLIVRNRIYVADYRGSVWQLELATGKIRARFDGQAPFYQPCTSDGQHVFCMGSNGILRCLSLNLQEKWQRTLPGVPTAPVVVTQNHLIVTTGQKRLFVVQKDSGQVAQTMKLKRRPASAVVADDGLVYMASEYDALFQLGKKPRRRP